MLPNYIQIEDKNADHCAILRAQAKEIIFPLSQEDQTIINVLKDKFYSEQSCSGLAAPQIGFSKRIIIFHIPEEVKKLRNDVYDCIAPTVLINPQYQPMNEERTLDWEACFSVRDTMAEISRYTHIQYQAYDIEGNFIQACAQGFLARVLQHEIGHLNGELFTDLITEKGRSGTIEAMRALRLQERESK